MATLSEQDLILQALHQQRCPIRLAVNGAQGYPHIVSLWFQYQQGEFYCVTAKSAWLVAQLQRDGRVGFEASTNAAPYKGVRGTGLCELEPLQGSLLQDLITHYLGGCDSKLARWLLSRQGNEVVIKITPQQQSCWDYTERMQGE